ncbi:MAG: hypothetical protein GQ529_11140 [Methyloprofundus sp.]|nr:hypothetical protein [Methyloprofundus sp.]
MNSKIINTILEAAVRAPSGDNVQPWKFQVSENFTSIDLYNLPEKDNSYYNYQQMASYIAHGAVIENIVIASSHLGYQAQVSLFPKENEPDLVATITLVQAEAQVEPLYQAIFERCTNRFQFKRAEITEEMRVKLSATVKNSDTADVSLIYQQDKINELSKELMVNDRLVFERKDIHHFLFSKIRWNKKQIEDTRDGMPVDTLGLNPMEKLTFPLMRFWSFVKFANYLGLSRIIGLKCWWNCRTASILGMVSIKGNDKFAFVQGGRAVQRVWLEATAQGLALQPIIGLTLLINRLKKQKLKEFSSEHTTMITRAAQSLPKQFGINESHTLIMGFRLGKGVPIKTRTKRRAVNF